MIEFLDFYHKIKISVEGLHDPISLITTSAHFKMKHPVAKLSPVCLFRFQASKIPSLYICYTAEIPNMCKMM